MATSKTTDKIDNPEMVSIKLANHEKEYMIEKSKLLSVSAYFRGMFAWDFKVRIPCTLLFYLLMKTGNRDQPDRLPR